MERTPPGAPLRCQTRSRRHDRSSPSRDVRTARGHGSGDGTISISHREEKMARRRTTKVMRAFLVASCEAFAAELDWIYELRCEWVVLQVLEGGER